MTLYLKYRPQSLSEIVGNEEIVESLTTILSKKDRPHSYLLTGGSGCGKTTIGRIIANEIGCKGNDYREIDSADFRGIDSIREIRKQSQFMPLEGSSKVFLLDECFASGTLISLADGTQKTIENIKVGDFVCNLKGVGHVLNTFKTIVNLERVVKVHLADGRSIICSKDHEFLTDQGWKKAINLNKKDFTFLDKNNRFKNDTNPLNTGWHHAKKSKLSVLRHNFIQKAKKVLFQSLQINRMCEARENGNTHLSYMQQKVYRKMVFPENNMFQDMRKYNSRNKTNWEKTQSGNVFKNINDEKNSYKSKSRSSETHFSNALKSYERKKPNEQPENNSKNESYQKNKWNIKYLAWGTWWKWEINRTTNFIINSIGMESRSANFNWVQVWRKWVSNKLQSRYWEFRIKNSNRSGWNGTSFERKTIIGQEKRGQIKRVGVDRIEIYQQGNNDKSFNGIIGDKEKSNGYVTFYDLEINGHYSYFANGCLVHNCHKISNDGMNALLKALEDTPPHVYYILCTTDPQKLLATIKGRCTQFKVNQLQPKEMRRLLSKIAKEEGMEVTKQIYESIIEASKGHPRNAIQMLEQVISVPEEKRNEIIQKNQEESTQVIELCRALIGNKGWKVIAEILTGIKDQDPEGIRRVVLGYCSSILLKGGEHNKAGLIMEEFKQPTYDIGFPGVVLACYSIVCGGE